MRSRRLHRLGAAIPIALGASVLLSCSAFDLVVSSIAVPDSVVPGEPLRVTSRVCNRSDAPTEPATLDLVMRTALEDDSPPVPDVPLGTRSVPPLQPDQCHSEESELAAPSGLPDGAYQVVGSIWPVGHARSSEVFGLGWGPDLVLAEMQRPLDALPWSSSPVTGRVCNRGTTWAPPSRVDLYLSNDSAIVGSTPVEGPADWPAGSMQVPDLAPGACATASGSLETSDPGQGLFLLGAIVDEGETVDELVESNNTRAIGLLGVGSLPDLLIDSISAPDSVHTFSTFEVEAIVCNVGTIPSPPTDLAVYLSEDDKIRPPPPSDPASGDVFAGAMPVPQLSPGECQSTRGDVSASVPFDGAWTVGAIADEGDWALELMEFNNRFAGPRIGIGNGPDLVVRRIEAPYSVAHDQGFEVDVELCNRGTAFSSGPSSVRLFLSRDPVLEPAPLGMDPEVGIAPAPDLQEGSCATLTVPAWMDGSIAGPARLLAMADGFSEVDELIETNNELAGAAIGIGLGPDLVVTGVAAPPSAQGGESFAVEVGVCNRGTAPSMPTSVSLYHSMDAMISSHPYPGYDIWLGEVMVGSSLMPGSCLSAGGVVSADPVAQGAWYIGGVVDEPDYVAELMETNNAFTGPIMGLGIGPDLVVTRVESGPAALPDSPLPVDFEVCNQGTSMASASQVSFFLSVNETIEGGPPAAFGDDLWLGSSSLPMLEPGRCHAGTGSAWVPPDADGELRLGALADEPQSITELVESNNALAGAWIGVGWGPDLIVTRVIGPPTAQPSGPILVDLQVCNQGTTGSPSAQLWLYLSADPQIEGSYFSPPGPDPWIGEIMLPPMPAGVCHDEVVEAPAWGTSAGEWYLGAIVDEGMHVDELLESNNVLLGHRIGLGNGPDLIVTSIGVPPSAENGLSFPFTLEICNQGTGTSSGVDIELYHSLDEQIVGYSSGALADFQFAYLTTGPLLVGECRSVAGNGSTWVPQDGAWFAGAIVDDARLVDELLESNNHFTGPLMGVGLGPDLVVRSLSGPTAAVEYSPLPVDVEVCNLGTLWSPMTMVTLYHSEDGTIDGLAGPLPPLDLYLGDLMVVDLPPGGCVADSVQVMAGPSGTGYLAAIVDESDQISELIEANNQSLGPALSVSPAP